MLEEEKKTEEEKEETRRKFPALRTFKTDSARYIKTKGISLIDIAAAKADKKGLGLEEEKRKSFKNIIFISLIIILLIGTGVSSFLIFKLKQKKSYEAVISPVSKSFLLTDQEKDITLEEVKQATQTFLNTKELLYLTIFQETTTETGEIKKESVTTNEFFNYFKIAPPLGLTESLEKRFMFVVFRSNKNWPALIFKLRSYDNAFIGMMKWEETMADDLADIFLIENSLISHKPFVDKEIQNHDVRVLSGASDEPILFSSFINKQYLIIASNEDVLKELFLRFASPQYLNE